jgi:hypothetical protein
MNYEESIKKQQLLQEKPMIKYVRSATHITKPENVPQYVSQKPINYDIPNREETDPTGPYVDPRPSNFANYPKYTYVSKPSEPVKQPQGMPMGYSMASGYVGGNWKGVKSPSNATVLTSNEIK